MPLSSHHRNATTVGPARLPFPAPYSPGEVIRVKRSFQGVMYALRAQGREGARPTPRRGETRREAARPRLH